MDSVECTHASTEALEENEPDLKKGHAMREVARDQGSQARAYRSSQRASEGRARSNRMAARRHELMLMVLERVSIATLWSGACVRACVRACALGTDNVQRWLRSCVACATADGRCMGGVRGAHGQATSRLEGHIRVHVLGIVTAPW
jgi:hypothetical protein